MSVDVSAFRAVADREAACVAESELNWLIVRFSRVVVVRPEICVLDRLAALRAFNTVVVAVVSWVVVSDLTWPELSSDN